MSFILTTIAGLSTMLGTLLIFFKFKNEDTIINKALSFAAGVMVTVSIFDLIPESYHLINTNYPSIIIVLISINIGIIVSMLINKYIPNDDNLYRVGLISMMAIIMHNIPEGIATYLSCTHNIKLGITLTIAIALHNIPEGITISLPIYYATKSKYKALLYTFISGISEVIGALLASMFLKNIMTDNLMGLLLGMIAGIMLYISFYELIPTAIKYRKIKTTLIASGVGVIVMLLSLIII